VSIEEHINSLQYRRFINLSRICHVSFKCERWDPCIRFFSPDMRRFFQFVTHFFASSLSVSVGNGFTNRPNFQAPVSTLYRFQIPCLFQCRHQTTQGIIKYAFPMPP
jgi:hypothetical protein